MKGRSTSHNHYINDGCGRDTYISFFNGGFHQYPYSNSYKKDYFEDSTKKYPPDLFKRRPIIKYDMDGKGRDFFIYQNILSEHDKIKGFTDFPNMLRTNLDLPPLNLCKSTNVNRFEKQLIKRIYYDRYKNKNLKLTEEDKKENDFSLNKNDNSLYQKTENDRYETSPNPINSINSINSYSNSDKDSDGLKKYKVKVGNENNSENLVDSIKNIFMFNYNRKKSQELEKQKTMYWI